MCVSDRRCSAVEGRDSASVAGSDCRTHEFWRVHMPGAMHRMGVYLGLVEEDDYEAETYANGADRGSSRRDDYAEARYSRETARADVATYSRAPREYAEESYPEARTEEISHYQITALHPRTYNEA